MIQYYTILTLAKSPYFVFLKLLFPFGKRIPFEIMGDGKALLIMIEQPVFALKYILDQFSKRCSFMQFNFNYHCSFGLRNSWSISASSFSIRFLIFSRFSSLWKLNRSLNRTMVCISFRQWESSCSRCATCSWFGTRKV